MLLDHGCRSRLRSRAAGTEPFASPAREALEAPIR